MAGSYSSHHAHDGRLATCQVPSTFPYGEKEELSGELAMK
jgi:hypothetical protein